MKKKLRLSILGFSEHIGMYLLLLVQLLMMLCGMNVLFASYQQQAMLEEPFAELLQQDGYYMSDYGWDPETSLIDQLQGEKEVYGFQSYVCNAYYGDVQIATHIMIYDDTFWKAYHPVMKFGRWMSPTRSGESAYCVATSNCPTSELSIPGVSTKLKVAGLLSDLTYLPLMDQWSRNGGLSENFYYTYNALREEEEDELTIWLLMPQTQWEKLGIASSKVDQGNYHIVTFTKPLSEEEIAYNEQLLTDNASPAISLSVLQERAEAARMENVHRYLPLLIALLAITIFGTLCAMAIHTLQDLHSYAIFYLCGMKWKTGAQIGTMQVGFLLALGLAICGAAYFVLQLTGQAAVFGLRFTWWNVAVSFLFCCIVVLLNSLILYCMIRSRTPITLIRSTET